MKARTLIVCAPTAITSGATTMTKDNWKTIRVPVEAYEKAKEQKENNNRTWGEQLVCNNTTTTEVVDCDNVASTDDIQNMRDEIIGSITAISGDVATTEDLQHLTGKITDLQTNLPSAVAEELHQ